jgi:hypothetical protein
MLNKLMQRVGDIFKPYTLDDFMEDAQPVDHKDVQRLKAVWNNYQQRKLFNNCY